MVLVVPRIAAGILQGEVEVVAPLAVLAVQQQLAVVVDHRIEAADGQGPVHEPGIQELVDPAHETQIGVSAAEAQSPAVRMVGLVAPLLVRRRVQAGRFVQGGLGGRGQIVAQDQPEGLGLGRLAGAADDGMVQDIDRLVRIQHEHPVPGAALQALVPRRGEVVLPGEVRHLRAELPTELDGPVAGAGVHHHDLVHQTLHGTQAVADVVGLVSGRSSQAKVSWLHPSPGSHRRPPPDTGVPSADPVPTMTSPSVRPEADRRQASGRDASSFAILASQRVPMDG